jgi:hypothetical protein
LDKTYPEDEVFDTMLEAEGDNEDPDTESMEDFNPPPGPSTPIIPDILPAHIVDMEKCIVFTSKILELLHKIHGVVCNRSICGKMDLDFVHNIARTACVNRKRKSFFSRM